MTVSGTDNDIVVQKDDGYIVLCDPLRPHPAMKTIPSRSGKSQRNKADLWRLLAFDVLVIVPCMRRGLSLFLDL